MALYLDSYFVVDTDYLVSAAPVNGSGAFDGAYDICCLLDVNGKPKQVYASYPTAAARDAAFAALVAQLRAEQAAGLTLSFGDEDEERDL